MHGANRLGGNSLSETVVFGKILGEHLAEALDDLPSAPLDKEAAREHLAALDALAAGTGPYEPEDLIDELRRLVWDHAGIVRTGEGLRGGLEGLLSLRERAHGLKAPDSSSGHPGRWLERALDLRAMLVAAEAVVRGALAREEPRGAHHREDFPTESDAWRKNMLCAGDEGAEQCGPSPGPTAGSVTRPSTRTTASTTTPSSRSAHAASPTACRDNGRNPCTPRPRPGTHPESIIP